MNNKQKQPKSFNTDGYLIFKANKQAEMLATTMADCRVEEKEIKEFVHRQRHLAFRAQTIFVSIEKFSYNLI